MSNLPANIKTALTERNIDVAVWSTLQNSVFPGAKDESILLAIDYCKARKMDILKKPCHIVPMYVKDAQTGNSNWRDVIMPSIYEQRITAFRTGQMAGQDEPVFGEIINHKGVNAPEWCKVTVYRLINGVRCAFSHTEYFAESCTTTKDGSINSMWTKRPRGQLAKCAEAGALRKAFPDELGGVITADEVGEEPQAANQTTNQTSTIIETTSVELATNEQIQRITELAEITNTPIEKILALTGKQSLNEIPKSGVEKVLNKLNVTLNAQEAEREKAQQSDNLGQEIPL